jgi:DNA-binding CsgD family transcriptional regulator
MNTGASQALRDCIDTLPGPAVYKDTDGVYQYLNIACGNLIGLPRHLDFIGGTDFDLPCGAAAYAEAFQEQDRQVMETGKESKILDIHPFAEGGTHVLLNSKKPWFDENKKIVGTLVQATDITSAYTMAISAQLAKYTGNLQNSFTLTGSGSHSNPDIALTQRETEVLFLALRGKTSKLIAVALGLSFRTVESYLEKIKLKFGVQSKVELLDIATARGYMNQIPLSVFSKQLSIVLASE